MRTTVVSTAVVLLLGLALSGCARVAEPGPGPIGTPRQPTASPSEIQDERSPAQSPGGPLGPSPLDEPDEADIE